MPEVLHAGKFIELVRIGRWEYARRTRSQRAVGIIARTDGGELVLVQQHRIPVSADTIELPAGLVGDEDAHEAVTTAARRELLEETGYEAQRIEHLFDGPSSAGLTDEQVDLVLATGLRQVHCGGGIEGERITVHTVAIDNLSEFLKLQRSRGIQIDFKVRLAEYMLRLRQQT
jgi:ADP-ribose pyrophosphatase